MRNVEEEDMKQVRDIVRDIWDFVDFMSCEKIADAAVAVYLNQFFRNSSFGKVALLDGEVVGVVFASVVGEAPTCRMLQGDHINNTITLMEAPDYVRSDFTLYIRTIIDANALLISGKVDEYDGSLDFLIVSQKAQGLKVGKKLWHQAATYFKKHQAQKIYLYTDTYCNVGFYEHNGFKRVNTKDIVMGFSEGNDQVSNYLYEYSFSEHSAEQKHT